MDDSDSKALEFVAQIMDSGVLGAKYESGPFNRKFAAAFAELYQVPFATTMSSGSAALEAALHACGVGVGDEVIVDPFLKYAPLAALRRRAIPVFVDINPDTLIMDPNAVARAVTPRTKAVVITALFGQPLDITPFRTAISQSGVMLIADCAQSLLAARGFRLVGGEFDCATFSFQASKHLSTGEGGMLITTNRRIYTRAVAMKDFGWHPDLGEEDVGEGWMSRMPEPVAAIGLARLKFAAEIVARHRKIAGILSDEILEADGVRVLRAEGKAEHSWWTWAIRINDPVSLNRVTAAMSRDPGGLQFGYCRAGLNFQRRIFSTYRSTDPTVARQFELADCPTASDLAPRIVHLLIDRARKDSSYAELGRRLRAALAS